MSQWVMGVDGGGTKTLMVLADAQGNLLGPYTTVGINPFDQPRWKAILLELLAKCPVPNEGISHATFGLPGYGEVGEVSESQKETVAAWANIVPATVVNDVQMALHGALLDRPGVLILAGTGSMAWGRTENQQVRTGGWNQWFGDEGSAFWVGLQALRMLSWCLDGRHDDRDFEQAMLSAIRVTNGGELLTWFQGLSHPRSQVACLASTVDALAEHSNQTSIAILSKASRYLVHQAKTAAAKLTFTGPTTMSYAGGLFTSQTIQNQVKVGVADFAVWQEPALNPAGGALWHAAKQAGWEVTPEWIRSVKEHLR